METRSHGQEEDKEKGDKIMPLGVGYDEVGASRRKRTRTATPKRKRPRKIKANTAKSVPGAKPPATRGAKLSAHAARLRRATRTRRTPEARKMAAVLAAYTGSAAGIAKRKEAGRIKANRPMKLK